MRSIPTLDNPGFGTTIGVIQVLLADDISDNVSYDPDIYFRPGPIGVKYKRPNGIDLYIRPVST